MSRQSSTKPRLRSSHPGATLSVRDGKALALHTGTASAEGALRCEGTPLLTRPLGDVTLPGRLDFGDGLSLCPAEAPAGAYPTPAAGPAVGVPR
jgi:hypothetical protein